MAAPFHVPASRNLEVEAECTMLNAARPDQAIVDLVVWRWSSMRRGQWDPVVAGHATTDVAHLEFSSSAERS
jgi:hypothetical protein